MNTVSNIEQLSIIARALGSFRNEIVFVGGAVVELYVNDPAAPPPRPTLDVDCFVEVSSRVEYAEVERELESRGFQHDMTPGAPICRWVYEEITVDVMPTDETILGFSNRWYSQKLRQTIQHPLESDINISLLAPPEFIASKLEALRNRGGTDLRTDPDFEDIIFVLDNRNGIIAEIEQRGGPVRKFIREQIRLLLDSSTIDESLAAVLPYGSGSEHRDHVKQILENLISVE